MTVSFAYSAAMYLNVSVIRLFCVAALVTFGVCVPAGAGAAPVVSMTASQVLPGVALVNATSNQIAIPFIGPHLVVYRTSGTPTRLMTCPTSVICVGTVPAAMMGTTSYRAYLIRGTDPAGLPTNPVAASPEQTVGTPVAPAGYTVSIEPAAVTVATGQSVIVTARLNRALSTGHVLEIFDVDAPSAIVASCSTGSTCTRAVSKAAGSTSRFHAVVRRVEDVARPPLSPIATSAIASVAPRPFATTLSASPTVVATGQSTTLTATANQPLVPATGAYSSDLARLVILNDTGTQVASCIQSPCTPTITPTGNGPFNYRAVVRASSIVNGTTTVSDLGSSNALVTRAVDPAPAPTVTLTTASPTMLTDRPNLVTAIASAPVSSAEQTRILIVDVTRDVAIKTCVSGATCSIDALLRSTAGLTVEAQVRRGAGAGQILARSGATHLPLAGFTVTIEPVGVPEVYTDELIRARVAFNQRPDLPDIDHTGSSVLYRIEDSSGDAYECSPLDFDGDDNPRTCEITGIARQTTPTVIAARVKKVGFNVDETLAYADTKFSLKPFEMSMEVSDWYGTTQVVSYVNHDPESAGGYMELVSIHNGASTVERTCDGCYETFGPYDTSDRHVLRIIGSDGQIIAATAPYPSPPTDGPGPNRPDETTGGGNPSEDCSGQRCGGDPITFSTGEFSLERTDSIVPGRGPGLEYTRSYSAFRASTRGSLGFGWTDNYSMRIQPDQPGTPFDTAAQVSVLQENGSRIYFKHEGNGLYSAPPRVLARLSRLANGTFALERRSGVVWHFDSTGLLSRITDRNGYETSVTRTPRGGLKQVTDNAGRSLKFETDGFGRVRKMTDPTDREWTYEYDELGVLRFVTPPTGGQARFVYDALHRMTSLTDYSGNETTNDYDSLGRVIDQRNPEDEHLRLNYSTPNSTLVTQASGSKTRYTFADMLLAEEVRHVGTPMEQTWTYEYDQETVGVTKVMLGTDTVRTVDYDARGNTIHETDGEGRETFREFDLRDLPIREIAPDGVESTYAYDSRGNLDRETIDPTSADPVAETTYEHESAAFPGDVTRMVDAENRPTSYTWSQRGYLERVDDGEDVSTSTEYDVLGRVTARIDGRGKRTKIEYLDDGRRERTTDPLGRVSQTLFDADARSERVEYPGSRVDTTTYDAAGRVRFERRNGQTRRELRYDAFGRLEASVDAKGRLTSYAYDDADRIESMTNPDVGTFEYAHDSRGRRNSVEDPLGRTVTTEFNDADEPTSIDYSDPTMSDVTIDRDAVGRIRTVTDGTGSSTREYDGFSRVKSDRDGASKTVTYRYDQTGNVTRLGYPGGDHVEYTYDDAGRMDLARDWFGQESSFDYDDNGALDLMSLANGITSSFDHNDAQQPTSIASTKSGSARPSFATAYEPVSGMVSGRSATNQTDGIDETYTYDAARRLETVTRGASAQTLTFDELDDLTRDETGSSVSRDTKRQASSYAPATGPSSTFVHSPLGERTSTTTGSSQTNYAYDQLSRLTDVSRDGLQLASYAYDWSGLRSSVTTSTGTRSMVWNRIEGLPVVLDDGARRFLYGPGGMPIAQAGQTAATVRYLHTDTHGSIRTLSDTSGAVTGSANYTAYGKRATGGETTPLGYAGQYTDAETGLQYLRARYYDPATGQFLTRDPIEEQTGDAYGYANSNPVMRNDPTGLLGIPGIDLDDYEFEVSGRDFANSWVNIGRGVTFGYSDDVVDHFNPGASCLVSQHRGQQIVGMLAVTIATSGTAPAGQVASRGALGFAKQSRRSGKERANDIPTVARQNPPLPGESKSEYLRRLYGDNPATGSKSPYSQTGKWYDRHWNGG